MVFTEALKLKSELMAQTIMRLWKAYGRCAESPKSWHRILLCLLFKSGDRAISRNYRPLSLLVHIRKVVESALDSIVKEVAKFQLSQSAFRKG